MLTLTQNGRAVALDITPDDLQRFTVEELAGQRASKRDKGGMWVPERKPLGRTLAFAIKSVQGRLFSTGHASLGYGLEATLS